MYLYIYITTYIHIPYIPTHMFEYIIMMRKRETRFTTITIHASRQYLLLCTVLSLIILLIVHYYTYTYVNIYTHIPRAHTYVISICREYITHDLGNVDVKKKKKESARIFNNCTRARTGLPLSLSEFFRSLYSPSCCVYSRVLCVCADATGI